MSRKNAKQNYRNRVYLTEILQFADLGSIEDLKGLNAFQPALHGKLHLEFDNQAGLCSSLCLGLPNPSAIPNTRLHRPGYLS